MCTMACPTTRPTFGCLSSPIGSALTSPSNGSAKRASSGYDFAPSYSGSCQRILGYTVSFSYPCIGSIPVVGVPAGTDAYTS